MGKLMRTLDSTPEEDGYWMPGEYAPHAQTWILWPIRTDIWPFGAKPAQRAFSRLAAAISEFEPVTVGVPRSQYEHARTVLGASVRIVELSYDGCWIRDTGPTTLVNGANGVRGVDWRFNAWGGTAGGLYFPWDQDDLVASKILDMERLDRYRAPFVLEGGAINADGEGTLLTTEECVLNANRNGSTSRSQMERQLKAYTGSEKVIWLPRGMARDETGGHVDNLCAFIRPGHVALAWSDERADPQYEIGRDALAVLEKEQDAKGRRLTVHKIPMPPPILITPEESESVDRNERTVPRPTGAPLPASYLNFYFVNGGLIVPLFEEETDSEVLKILRGILPRRKVVGVPTRDMLMGGGNVHCNVQQQSAPTTDRAETG